MAIRSKGGTKIETIKVPMTPGEAYVAGKAYAITNGYATASATTAAPEAIALLQSNAATTAYREYDFLKVTNSAAFLIDITDAGGDCFYMAATGGAASGLTLVDSVNRNEADSYWVGGIVGVHGLPGASGGNIQYRVITASDQSDTNITVSAPFTDMNGDIVQITSAYRYTIVKFAPGLMTAALNSDLTGIDAEQTGSGKVIIDGMPNFDRAADGIAYVPIRFDI